MDIKYNKCAFISDAFVDLEKECDCPKITMDLFHKGECYSVSVCRNYYAELFKRNYNDIQKIRYIGYDSKCFMACSMSKMDILIDLFGSHIHESIKLRYSIYDFQKLNKRSYMDTFYVDTEYRGYFLKGHIYIPHLYALLDFKTAVRYDLNTVFEFICQHGIEKASEIFIDRHCLHRIIQQSIKKMVETLESNSIRYKKRLVSPILSTLKNKYYNAEIYEIDAINALSEILTSLAKKQLTY